MSGSVVHVTTSPTIHATAVLVGAKAVLIQGEPGSGKSRLALRLLETAGRELPFARLVGDDRVYLESRAGRLIVRAPEELAGLLEIRGTGIVRVAFEPAAIVGLVIELGQPAERMPAAESRKAVLRGVILPRLAVPPGVDPLPLAIEASLGRFGPI
jgi:serine kinase of HPr protein (carbohydrate metabolism regulator)